MYVNAEIRHSRLGSILKCPSGFCLGEIALQKKAGVVKSELDTAQVVDELLFTQDAYVRTRRALQAQFLP